MARSPPCCLCGAGGMWLSGWFGRRGLWGIHEGLPPALVASPGPRVGAAWFARLLDSGFQDGQIDLHADGQIRHTTWAIHFGVSPLAVRGTLDQGHALTAMVMEISLGISGGGTNAPNAMGTAEHHE
jgi:hypothetical protein